MSTRRNIPVPWWAPVVALLALFAIGGWYVWHGRAAPAAGDGLERQLADAGIDTRQRGAIEGIVRQYILDHPDIIPEAVERLQTQQASARIAPLRAALETPFPGAVLGNPDGRTTLVAFTDYACSYCRASVPDVKALLAANPDLRVVIRELPIISPASEGVARLALAAAAQGKYAAFHNALYAQPHPDAAGVAAAAEQAGVDLGKAHAGAGAAEITRELSQNLALARQIGINGTPAWLAGNTLLTGAVGRERLEQALNEAKAAAKPAG